MKKPCSDCGELLEATTANFHANPSHWDGLEYECRTCRNQRERERTATRHRYASPPMPEGPPCLCGYPLRNGVCNNCGLGYIMLKRRVA
jgi:hypothetical protein